jgi:hypothetical protein
LQIVPLDGLLAELESDSALIAKLPLARMNEAVQQAIAASLA